jgi:hypothetical protein
MTDDRLTPEAQAALYPATVSPGPGYGPLEGAVENHGTQSIGTDGRPADSDDIVFKIENGDVKIYRGQAFCGNLGTLLPYSEEQFLRLLYRAEQRGADRKAREIRSVLGIREPR